MKWSKAKKCPACNKPYVLSAAAIKHWNSAHEEKYGSFHDHLSLWKYVDGEYSLGMAKAGSSTGRTREDAFEAWGIDKSLNLNTNIADFYLLMVMCLVKPGDHERDASDFVFKQTVGAFPEQTFSYVPDAEGRLQRLKVHRPDDRDGRYATLLAYLASQFAAYLDMVVGGEIRHAVGRPTVMASTPLPLRQALRRSGPIPLPADRASCWWYWRRFRERHGTVALQWVVDCYSADNGWGGGGYGGHKWKECTDALLQYEQGKLTPEMFVDLAVHLEHNGGSVFNKVWGSVEKSLLDAKYVGDYDVLLPYASDEVRNLYTQSMDASRYNPTHCYRYQNSGIWIDGD